MARVTEPEMIKEYQSSVKRIFIVNGKIDHAFSNEWYIPSWWKRIKKKKKK